MTLLNSKPSSPSVYDIDSERVLRTICERGLTWTDSILLHIHVTGGITRGLREVLDGLENMGCIRSISSHAQQTRQYTPTQLGHASLVE